MTRSDSRSANPSKGGAEGAPQSVAEALERARIHAQAAVSEALLAARAVLDAASIGVSGSPSDAHRALGTLSRGLDELAASLSRESAGLSPAIVETILEALDAEIARWEDRSSLDPDARSVLRAFIGLREILWEFGLRRDTETHPRSTRAASKPRRHRPAHREKPAREAAPRVQRVQVKG